MAEREAAAALRAAGGAGAGPHNVDEYEAKRGVWGLCSVRKVCEDYERDAERLPVGRAPTP